ncbi:hypothetical protein [Sinorhizobium meliloti]|uniref:hypothetical protein n=1 Tax=Rhizobium meliloti TaxID=382 RepID=UPI000FD24F73|nr:hypothetical protein [Sinorhizobium meliloti]RVJ89866.1 hypothetical protein CN173_24680 [Sinorhizobium meliloti]
MNDIKAQLFGVSLAKSDLIFDGLIVLQVRRIPCIYDSAPHDGRLSLAADDIIASMRACLTAKALTKARNASRAVSPLLELLMGAS